MGKSVRTILNINVAPKYGKLGSQVSILSPGINTFCDSWGLLLNAWVFVKCDDNRQHFIVCWVRLLYNRHIMIHLFTSACLEESMHYTVVCKGGSYGTGRHSTECSQEAWLCMTEGMWNRFCQQPEFSGKETYPQGSLSDPLPNQQLDRSIWRSHSKRSTPHYSICCNFVAM